MCALKATLLQRALGRALIAWRERSGLSGAETARKAGWSTAKMSMMQNAACPVFEVDVATLALILQIDPAQRELACRTAQRARDPMIWDRVTGGELPCLDWSYAEVEAEAGEVRIHRDRHRSAPVADSRLRRGGPGGSGGGVLRPATALRRPTSAAHARPAERPLPLRLHVVLSQAVLRRMVGGVRVMTDQLLRLLTLAELSNVTIQIVPDQVGAYAGMGMPFTILSCWEDRFDDVVYAEHLHTTSWLESAEDREPYEQTFAKLRYTAMSENDSLTCIGEALQDLQQWADMTATT